MAFYVGAERKNPVQREAAWRRRVEQEEGAAVRATNPSAVDIFRPSPITWQSPPESRAGVYTPRSMASSGRSRASMAGQKALRCAGGLVSQVEKFDRLGTAASGVSVATSVSSRAVRSTVLSMELEIERERREAAEKEVEQLRAKLAERDTRNR